MSQYDPLRRYLAALPSSTNQVTLTFSQIEQALGFVLPASASRYREWWTNPSKPDQHPYAQAWIVEGFRTCDLDLTRQQVTFRRTNASPVRGNLPHQSQPNVRATQTNSPLPGARQPDSPNVSFLLQLGFQPAGEWRLVDGALAYALTRHRGDSHVLYAFVVAGEVAYIGKTARTLATRMNGYQTPGSSQRTNIANHARLVEALSEDKRVEILVFAPTEEMRYHGVVIDLAGGLEDPLIARFKPPWNKLGSG